MTSGAIRIILTIAVILPAAVHSGCTEEIVPRRVTDNLASPNALAKYLAAQPAVKNATTWPNEYALGVVVETAHYKIYSTLLDPLMLRLTPAFMESAHDAYQRQLPERVETTTPFTIYLFADRTQWEEFTETFAGPNAHLYLKIQKGAYYLNGACVAYNIGRARTFAALGHEGWHQFNSRHFAYRLPSWLDEGIATLFEANRKSGGGFEFVPDANLGRLQSLKQALARNSMIPLENLIALNPSQLVADTGEVRKFYAQSYALVRFLREDDYGRRLKNYQNMLLAAFKGRWPVDDDLRKTAADRNILLTTRYNVRLSPKLFDIYFNAPAATLKDEYLAFCRRNVYHIPMGN